ncbi:protein gamma response 1 isoform X2 [Spinacia oleracea]|uniref:Protein gamma response 1 n=1 Tax=Spinacia oleracea TaxID=3562 RepID=A0A9R0IAN9_SPIOL|nr:protein gamma response 1 isoform X2 [Spinacia oleracea]XP_056686636.1 protein gamma response 1 isoform X2 [Spinacia oleracea]
MHLNQFEKSPEIYHQVESNEQHVSDASTLLVASIQEAKDKISQIEYIFCSQLYPNFHKTAKSLKKVYLEARNAAENEWKERQSELEIQMKQLFLEKELARDESKAFRAEKSRLLTRVAELEDKLLQKEKEFDDRMKSHATLLDLMEAKTTTIREKDLLMKEHEERMKLLVTKSEELEGKTDALNKEIQEKKNEITSEKELTKDLQKQIESQDLKIRNTEQMLRKSEEENKQLLTKLEHVEASLDGLRNELRGKKFEAEEAKLLHENLVQKVNWCATELTKKSQQLSAHDREKQMLLSAEKLKYNNLHAGYKNLKSQLNYLLKKFSLTNKDLPIKAEEESDPLNNDETDFTLSEISKRKPTSTVVACELNKVKKEMNIMESSENEKIGRQNQIPSSKAPSGSDPATTTTTATHWTTSGKTRNLSSLAGGKRPGSGWRETRARQSPGGADPHDDFLDTPYEEIRGNMHKTVKDSSARDDVTAECGPQGVDSDDETQDNDMKAESAPKRQQLQALPSRSGDGDGPRGFKYVEPVRKKADRENLNGIECKQCKKFYDAVRSDAKDGEFDRENLRCEHHDGVSRHRYRYAPPLTPEGFWNIGFDTET